MFVGFIAVVVILLVIVGLMATGTLGGSQNSSYITEAKKTHTMVSNMNGESKFYYVQAGETFLGLNMDYFVRANFAPQNLVTTNPGMNSADWSGWPTSLDADSKYDVNNDGVLDSPYTGPYLKVGGVAGDDLRIIAHSISDGNYVGFHLLKKNGSSLSDDYIKILEKQLASDPEYVGG